MLQTLKSKFVFFLFLFSLIIIGTPTIFLLDQLKRNFDYRSRFFLESTFDLFMNGLNNAMLIGQKDIQHELDYLATNKNINGLRIFDKTGIIKYSVNKSELGINILDVAAHHENFNLIKDKKLSVVPSKHIYSIAGSIKNQSKCNSCHGTSEVIAYIDLDANLTPYEENFLKFYNNIPYYAATILLMIIVGAYFLFDRFISAPLRLFEKAIDKLKTGNFNLQLSDNRKDEIGDLDRHFNQMVNELKISKEKIDELHFEQVQRANKLAVLGELTSEIAHEVNNHSAIIRARTENLLDEIQLNSQVETKKKDFEVILSQIDQISKITESILLHSKKKLSKFREIDLVTIIQESLLILKPKIKKEKIQLLTNLELKSAKIFGEPSHVGQILINLINNSIDAIQTDGEISISLEEFGDNKFILRITDNGKGISKENISHVFSPFFSTKQEEKGTGLGLYIVHNICKDHGASISCDSKPNKGTSFTIIFNRNEENTNN